MKAIPAAGLLLLLFVGQTLALPPAADGFPAQPITILVPRGHGGASYQFSAAMATALEPHRYPHLARYNILELATDPNI